MTVGVWMSGETLLGEMSEPEGGVASRRDVQSLTLTFLSVCAVLKGAVWSSR